MKLSEMKQAVELSANEWDLGKVSSKANGNVCAWIYLLEILEETEKMVIEKDNGKLIYKNCHRNTKIIKGGKTVQDWLNQNENINEYDLIIIGTPIRMGINPK